MAVRNKSSEKINTDRALSKTGFRSDKRSCRPALPEMPDELVLEILLRLPVKSLLKFKCVCKDWHAIISGPSFIRMHLERSVSNQQRQSCYLITPHLLDYASDDLWPNTFSNNIRFYRWQHESCQASASLVYARNFQREFGSVYRFAHCDGLVLLPTDNKMYVVNPATRDLLTLPESPRRMLEPSSFYRGNVGFGRDPCTNKYKVVQCFRHSTDNGLGSYSTGMEVFTIGSNMNSGSAAWRDAMPPYPVGNWKNATFFKGSLFWILRKLRQREPPETRLLRFCLQAETFSFTPHPPCPALDHQNFAMSALEGELCLAQYESSQRVVIWMTSDGEDPKWNRRYIVDVEPCVTIAISQSGLQESEPYDLTVQLPGSERGGCGWVGSSEVPWTRGAHCGVQGTKHVLLRCDSLHRKSRSPTQCKMKCGAQFM
ncbi:F-box protein At3g07870-like [Triticum aestivum]|nr:F-box protein At3g07870-like [Triticum aestivum]